MDRRRIAGTLHFAAGCVFIAVGLMDNPQNRTYVVLGIVFIFIGVLRLRLGRPGPPPPS